jgi:hypothetical protein
VLVSLPRAPAEQKFLRRFFQKAAAFFLLNSLVTFPKVFGSTPCRPV